MCLILHFNRIRFVSLIKISLQLIGRQKVTLLNQFLYFLCVFLLFLSSAGRPADPAFFFFVFFVFFLSFLSSAGRPAGRASAPPRGRPPLLEGFSRWPRFQGLPLHTVHTPRGKAHVHA